jgi:hypothetical protein
VSERSYISAIPAYVPVADEVRCRVLPPESCKPAWPAKNSITPLPLTVAWPDTWNPWVITYTPGDSVITACPDTWNVEYVPGLAVTL